MKYLELSFVPLLMGSLPLGLLSGVHPALGCAGVHPALGCAGVAMQVAGVATGLTLLAAGCLASKSTRE